MSAIIIRRVFAAFLLPALLVAAWWTASSGSQSPYFPPLGNILASIRHEWLGPRAWTDIVPSMLRLVAGYALAAAGSIALGVLVGLNRRLRVALEPALEFFRAIPPPLLIPPFMLFFGIGDLMKILVIAFGCTWSVLLNTIEGVRSVDEVQLDTARSFGVNGWARLWHIILPAASPHIFSGLRLALSIAFILTVISEMFAASAGIGYAIVQAQRTFALTTMWGGMVVLGLLGVLAYLVFSVYERWQLGWYRGSRQAERSL